MTESSGVSVDGIPQQTGGAPRPRLNIKLAASLGFGNLGIYLVWGAVPGLLLALQLQGADPAHKATNLAWVGAIGATVSMLVQPFWGTLSDRTRSRYGKRAPFLLGGGVLGAAALIGLALSSTVIMIGVSWCLVQATVNAAQGPLAAVLPDRVPVAVRGAASTILGFGTMAGSLGGQILASTLAPRGYLLTYGAVAAVLIVATVTFVLLNPDRSSAGEPREPFSLMTLLRTYWVDPVRYPDFAWTFLGRLLLMLGYFCVSTYQLYILQDYIGLSQAAALGLVPVFGLISLAGISTSMLVSGWLSDRIGRRKPFVFLSSIIVGLGFAVPFVLPTTTGMLINTAVAGFGVGCYMTVDAALFSQVLPSAGDAAKDLGVANIANAGPQVLAPAVAGFIVAQFGGYHPLFLFALGFSVLGALCMIPIKSVK